jgi:hypothetical protein
MLRNHSGSASQIVSNLDAVDDRLRRSYQPIRWRGSGGSNRIYGFNVGVARVPRVAHLISCVLHAPICLVRRHQVDFSLTSRLSVRQTQIHDSRGHIIYCVV